ncbi:hypothetical protein R5R35_002845 [Gryllus longicercus]|uniref:RING-type domain-containing protein n=1 Tax=Gryllus longicercus TaxID=2509291 RepID=A0AAN9VDR5_9ORTH
MSYLDLFCNYIQCRERLNNKAVITSCSHAFCMHHGNQILSNELMCPACKTPLNKNKYDLTCADLNPSEDFRSMILAGLRPEIIIDIAHRAISFWSYQIHMENMYHIIQYQEWKKKHSELQQVHETWKNNHKIKINHLQQRVADLEKQLQYQAKISEELQQKLHEKNREHTTTLQKFTSLKHRQLSESAKFSMLQDQHPVGNTKNNIDIYSLEKNSEFFAVPSSLPGFHIGSVPRHKKLHCVRTTIIEPHSLFQDGDKTCKKKTSTKINRK